MVTETGISFAVSGSGTYSKSPDKSEYSIGEYVTITATPNSGYQLKEIKDITNGRTWYSSPVNMEILSTYTEMEIVFEEIPATKFVLTLNATNGSILKSPNYASYDDGTAVSLLPNPNTNYVFTGWSGDAYGTSQPFVITMNGNKTVTANFSPVQRTLTTNATNGTIKRSPEKATYDNNELVSLTAVPNTGYIFKEWNTNLTGSDNPRTITMDADKSVTAIFEEYVLPPAGTSTLTDGLVSYYKFDGDAKDSVGTNDGTVDGATLTTGKINQGYNFDGNDDYIYSNIAEDLTKNQHTINIWAKAEDLTKNQVIWEQGSGSSNRFLLWLDDQASGSEDWIRIYANGHVGTIHYKITDNNFHMYTVVIDNGVATLYVDNVSMGSTSFTSFSRSADTFYFGRRPGNGDYLKGTLDEPAIWSRALTQAEVTELYNAGAGNQYPFGTTPPTPVTKSFTKQCNGYLILKTVNRIEKSINASLTLKQEINKIVKGFLKMQNRYTKKLNSALYLRNKFDKPLNAFISSSTQAQKQLNANIYAIRKQEKELKAMIYKTFSTTKELNAFISSSKTLTKNLNSMLSLRYKNTKDLNAFISASQSLKKDINASLILRKVLSRQINAFLTTSKIKKYQINAALYCNDSYKPKLKTVQKTKPKIRDAFFYK